MKRRTSLMDKLVQFLPRNKQLHRICEHYLERYHNDNNAYIPKNGEMRWLKEVVGECRVVFDVGANVGDWTEIALNLNPQLRVHCFEPTTATFQRLQSRLFINERVILNNVGLGSVAGEVDLYLFSKTTAFNSIHRRSGLETEEMRIEKIQIDTLDAYCTRAGVEQIDLLKLDVEGNELSVLQGGHELLSRRAIKRIQFEYSATYIDARIFLKDMFELLASYGYKLYKIDRERLQAVNTYRYEMENFHYQNWVALL